MKRPPPKVIEGLRTIAGIVGAGSSADILGYDEDRLDADGKLSWEQIQAACEWITHL